MPTRPYRAVLIGVGVGAVGAIANVFVSLKAGWSLPVMTTAAVVGLGVARAQKRDLAAGEAVVATSLASATAYATGGGNLAAIPAAVMLGVAAPKTPALIVWFAVTAILGTVLAPLLVNVVQGLRFPTATAAATLVQEGGQGAHTGAARALWRAALAGAVFALLRKLARAPAAIAGPYTFGVDTSLLLVGVGSLMTWTTAWSTLVGAVVTYAVVAPRVVSAGLASADYRSLVGVMVWPAASLLVASALTELAFDARKLLRGGRARDSKRALAFAFLRPLAAAIVAALAARVLFDLAWPAIVASIPIALLFAYVAARSMGETDVVPTKALAPLAQATIALVGRGVAGPTLAPNLTGAAAIHAADTLGSLKVATMLGVPRETAIRARLVGCILGAVIVALTFERVVPDARALPTPDLPAPAALVWKSVAEIVGAGALPPAMRAPILAGALLGAVLAALGRIERLAPYIPSAMGLGSGMVLPASTALSIFIGAAARRALEPRLGPAVTMAIASGIIAGESLLGLALQLWG